MKGVTPVRGLTREAADALRAQLPSRADQRFTLLGDGIRWREADAGAPVSWFRNGLYAPPIDAGLTDNEIQVALTSWTEPPDASIVLSFGGTRFDNGPADGFYCTPVNAGAGLITFGDPHDELGAAILAVGGGCYDPSQVHEVSGHPFTAFTHGYVVMNDDLAPPYTVAPNLTRILTHEVGHGIGLGHACEGTCTTADAENIMYPSCCLSEAPVPPALGPDDRAGLVFIYPEASCTISLAPVNTDIPAWGGSGAIGVTPSRADCTWAATTEAPWVTITAGNSGTGPGHVDFTAAPNIGGGARTAAIVVSGQEVTISQAADTDEDDDDLPDAWETIFGLDPGSASGDAGASGNPDGDDKTNAEELDAGTHPRGFHVRYLAEGVVNEFFNTEIALLNPGTAGTAVLRLQPQDQPMERTFFVQLPPATRHTVTAATIAAQTGAPFSTIVESDVPLVVDRTMSWDASGYGSHAETAIVAPSTTWFLAEGSTADAFELFYLLQNPHDVPVRATVRYLLPAPHQPVTKTYTLRPHSRTTITVAGENAALASADVSAAITAERPIIVERAMYRDLPGQTFAAGHASAGVTAAATEWFLAEGATGPLFQLFVLIANPGDEEADVDIDYLLEDGTVLTKRYDVPASSRYTIWVDDEQIPARSGNRPLAHVNVSMRVRSVNGQPIVVERAMWWPDLFWWEAHNTAGATETGTMWGVAAGEEGGATEVSTFLLIANTSASAGEAEVRLYFEDGTSPPTRRVPLPPDSRTTVHVGTLFPEAQNRRFGVVVESVGSPPAQIVVERTMYANPGGFVWASGSAAVGTRLLP